MRRVPWKRVCWTLSRRERLTDPVKDKLVTVVAEMKSVVAQEAPPAATSFISKHVLIKVDEYQARTPRCKLHLPRLDYTACSVGIRLDGGAGPLVNIVR